MHNSSKKPLKVQSFIAIIKKSARGSKKNKPAIVFDGKQTHHLLLSEDNKIEIAFILRKNNVKTPDLISDNYGSLILGDDSEWEYTHGHKCMGNGVFIEYDLSRKYLKLMTSVIGLPPVFLYKESSRLIITSDLHLLTKITDLDLYFDSEGIKDFCEIGHPIQHRTLFRNTSMIQAGYSATVNEDCEIAIKKAWNLPDAKPQKDWNSYTELQIDAFNKSMRDFDLSDTFLSLTAGLDTRTVLAELIQNGTLLPAYTMSGKNISLDARIAKKLSRAYGMRHNIIMLDEEFHKDIPRYLLEASRLSGGLASLEQSTEVYFNTMVDGLYTARLSGNLGNQVGRRGTERISLRNADSSVLSGDFIETFSQNSREHWYTNKTRDGLLDYEFLLQNEVPFSSASNYCIGNHFFIQQTPYADVRLIEVTRHAPRSEDQKDSLSLFQLRLKDLRHRFLGGPEIFSFQRKLIKRIGGVVASCPINWGWRAKGGLSFSGLIAGTLTFADAIACSKGFDSGLTGKGLKMARITGLHEFRYHKKWMKSYLKEFVIDTLSSNSAKNCGLFNLKNVNKMLKEHFLSVKCHHKALTFALDLALAQQIFKAKC